MTQMLVSHINMRSFKVFENGVRNQQIRLITELRSKHRMETRFEILVQQLVNEDEN